MYRVEVKNACSCFIKSGFSEQQQFETKEAAKAEAQYMLGVMNSTFCHKHRFSLSEMAGDFTIMITPNSK